MKFSKKKHFLYIYLKKCILNTVKCIYCLFKNNYFRVIINKMKKDKAKVTITFALSIKFV
ncbi:hypothetical protein EVI01_09950 [Enterococcus villorum]|uniref:Uncharacterized protein n=2 Tax=Enterococcus villorum TaxID=112904 RepID=A0A511J0X9_9ENTE|nr:hypothetical protein UAO_01453 [Enterococcus villorum ATCC 700913]GEL91658.1 hypothetical protein EVI01_09950 [Enterococcus villorum]